MGSGSAIELGIGGVGGVYFLVEPGELIIDLEKRDRNIRGHRTDLRAILVGPDREVLQRAEIPDDGQPAGSGTGPAGRARLSARVERKGIYGLNVTVSNDRYGEEIIWGFRTNCSHYLIETSRGHRSARRQEPIVLLNPDRPGDVCFAPRKGAFGMEIADLPDGVAALDVYDAKDALVHTLPVVDGRASHTFPADVQRDAAPWRLHLPAQQGTLQIDGVTRWEDGDAYPNLPCWTPDADAFFPLQMYRWILTPYSRTAYGRSGETGEIVFRVNNNSEERQAFQLGIAFPKDEWPVRLASEHVEVDARETVEITVHYTVPDEGARVCHIWATPAAHPDFSTYSTLRVKAGVAPATQRLEMPIVLRPYRHENEQFGYLPDYPVENQVYFDLENRPFVRTSAGVEALRDGQWVCTDLSTAVRSHSGATYGVSSNKIAFDSDNDVYLVSSTGGQAVLLHSADGGRTFSAYPLEAPGERRCVYDIEQFSGCNTPQGPPPIVRYRQTASDERLIWRKINDLELLLPQKVNGRLVVGEPIRITDRCIGLAAHSGIPSTVVSQGSKVHVAWGEATDPGGDEPGVPAYVVTYDRETGKLGDPVLIGYGAPPNDVHNSPCITMDSQGYLHAVGGTHGQPFQYARSLVPNDAHGGWTETVAVGEGLRQTYIGLVCGPEDTLHMAFRLWREDPTYFAVGRYASLSCQKKRPAEGWEAPRILLVAAFSEYSIYYHRLTIDRTGRLFLSHDYWSTYWFYRMDHLGRRRTLLMSGDGGETWKLAETEDFL